MWLPFQLFLWLLLLLCLFFGSFVFKMVSWLLEMGSDFLNPCNNRAPKPNLDGLCVVAAEMDECVDVVGDCGLLWSMALVDNVAGERFGFWIVLKMGNSLSCTSVIRFNDWLSRSRVSPVRRRPARWRRKPWILFCRPFVLPSHECPPESSFVDSLVLDSPLMICTENVAEPELDPDAPPHAEFPGSCESLESSFESRRCVWNGFVESTILCARFFRFSESSSSDDEHEAVRALLNLERRWACAPLWCDELRWFVKFVCLTTGRGVVVVLVSDDPTSVPSSNISFRHIAPGRMVLVRVGDGIVLYFGGLTGAAGVCVASGSVIVAESVRNFISTMSAAQSPFTATSLFTEFERSPFWDSFSLFVDCTELGFGDGGSIIVWNTVSFALLCNSIGRGMGFWPSGRIRPKRFGSISLAVNTFTLQMPSKTLRVGAMAAAIVLTAHSFFNRSVSAKRSCTVILMRPSDFEPRRFNEPSSRSASSSSSSSSSWTILHFRARLVWKHSKSFQ